MATVVVEPANQRIPPEQHFVFRSLDWFSYRKLSEALAGRHLRLAYDRGSLELMTVGFLHGNYSRLLARFVIVLTEEMDMTVRTCGDTTCDREDMERGLQPDEGFYLINEPLVRDKEQIDLTVDPPPDLTAEVDIARSSLNRLSIYAALKVPEVWRFDGQQVTIHQLQANGQYAIVESSRYFPFLRGADLARFLLQRGEVEENA